MVGVGYSAISLAAIGLIILAGMILPGNTVPVERIDESFWLLGEVAGFFRGGGNGADGALALPDIGSLPIAEDEGLVFDDRAAGGEAVLVALVLRGLVVAKKFLASMIEIAQELVTCVPWIWFVPDLIVTLITAPVPRPYSAE